MLPQQNFNVGHTVGEPGAVLAPFGPPHVDPPPLDANRHEFVCLLFVLYGPQECPKLNCTNEMAAKGRRRRVGPAHDPSRAWPRLPILRRGRTSPRVVFASLVLFFTPKKEPWAALGLAGWPQLRPYVQVVERLLASRGQSWKQGAEARARGQSRATALREKCRAKPGENDAETCRAINPSLLSPAPRKCRALNPSLLSPLSPSHIPSPLASSLFLLSRGPPNANYCIFLLRHN